jgi:hypothetical protein
MEKYLKRLSKLADAINNESRADDDVSGGELPSPQKEWVAELYTIIDEIEKVERVAPDFINIVDKHWSFDENQCHTHTWHDKQDCLKELEKFIAPSDDLSPEERKEEVAKFQRGIDERAETEPLVKAIDEVMKEDRQKEIEMENYFLALIGGVVKHENVDGCPNEIFFCFETIVYFHLTTPLFHNKTKSYLFVKVALWDAIVSKFNLGIPEMREFLKGMIEKYLKLNCDPERVMIHRGLQVTFLS